jgi:hypothetical protein
MVRHGRLRKVNERKKIEDFDSQLNRHIKVVEDNCAESWNFILDYIDSECSVPSRFFNPAHSGDHLAKEAFRVQGKAEIFYRLARLKDQQQEEGKQ